MEDDRRDYERVNLQKEVLIEKAKKRWKTTLLDISLKGLLVEKPGGWPGEVGDKFSISILLGKDEVPSIDLDAEVAHAEEGRVGFVWRSIDVDSLDHLRQLLEYNLEDPREVEKELGTMFEREFET